jgi:hypothetical protein
VEFTSLTSPYPGDLLCLPPTAWIRSTPTVAPSASQSPGDLAFTARLWDGTVPDYPYEGNVRLGKAALAAAAVAQVYTEGDLDSASALGAEILTYTQPVVGNQAPVVLRDGSVVTALDQTMAAGATSTFTLTVSDADSTAWSWTWADADAALDLAISVGQSAGDVVTVTVTSTHTASTTERLISGTLTVHDNQGTATALPTTITLPAVANAAPVVLRDDSVVTALDQTMAAGATSTFTLTVRDADSTAWSWTWADADAALDLAISVGQSAGDAVTVTATSTHVASATQRQITGTLTVQDSQGATTALPTTITLSAAANAAPTFLVTPGTIAVIGQPYVGTIVASDPDGDALTLSFDGAIPAGLTLTDAGGGRGSITGVPTTTRLDCVVRARDALGNQTLSSIALVAANLTATALPEPSTPPSSLATPRFVAIAPGSAPAFNDLRALLQPLGAAQARAFWWSGSAYQDVVDTLPPSERRSTAAVFLANTVPVSFVRSVTPLPVPFIVPLANGWNFYGLPPLWDGISVRTAHPWDAFILTERDGTPITSPSTLLSALAPSGATTIPAPWTYDPSTGYAASTGQTSGDGYWLRNRSGRALNLVRVADGAAGTRLGQVGRIGQAAGRPVLAAAPATEDQPPAPPGALGSQPQVMPLVGATDDGGRCGSGLALILAGGALIGLVRRRRG